ncbi:hypothetical protein RI367_000531 [Sorochytrium milnesiophthora]
MSIHPLAHTWTFWYSFRSQRQKVQNYESEIKPLVSFSTVEEFWRVYANLKRPHELPPISDYQLFRDGIKPVWEDAANINGGKWMLRLRKGVVDRIWENLIFAVIGGQLQQDVCGIVVSIRQGEDIVSLWNADASTAAANLQLRDVLKRLLGLPESVIMEYKAHRDALKDRSSFKNADVFR